MRGAVFFDVDGTLVPHTSSGQHLAELLGHAEVVREAEAGYLESLPLATLAWEPVGAYLCDRFGFDRYCGPRLEVIDGRAAAHASVDGNDLRDVLPVLKTWLEATP